MSMSYVRNAYGVPAKRGMWVKYRIHTGHVVRGKILSAKHYLAIRFEGDLRRSLVHPTDENLTYFGMEMPEAER